MVITDFKVIQVKYYIQIWEAFQKTTTEEIVKTELKGEGIQTKSLFRIELKQ